MAVPGKKSCQQGCFLGAGRVPEEIAVKFLGGHMGAVLCQAKPPVLASLVRIRQKGGHCQLADDFLHCDIAGEIPKGWLGQLRLKRMSQQTVKGQVEQ